MSNYEGFLFLHATTASTTGFSKLLRVFLCLIIAFALFPLAPVQAYADEPQVKTVRVGWLVNNEGFQEGLPGERMSGWGYEYLQTLSYYTPGWRYEYVTGSFGELMQKLEAGEIDLMPNISYTDERAKSLLYSTNPQGTEHYYIYAKPDRADLFKGKPKALEGMTIGANSPQVMQTKVGMKWLKKKGVKCRYKFYETADELYSALSAGKVDAIIMNDTLSSDDAMPLFNVGQSDYYLVTPKAKQDLMDDIDTAMAAIQRVNPRYNDEVKTRYSVSNGGTSALTQDERDWLDACGNTITVGYLDHLLPYSNKGDDGAVEGALSALVETLRDEFEINVKTVAFSSNEDMSQALSRGEVDVVMPVARDYWLAEKDGSVQSAAITSTSLVAIYAGGDLSDALASIAYHPSSLYNGNQLRAYYPDAQITRYASGKDCVKALKTGKAKCILIAVTGLETLRDEIDFGDLKTAELEDNIELSCWMRQGRPELLTIVNKGISLSKNQVLAAAYSHYSYADKSDGFALFIEKHATTIAICIILLLVGVIAVLLWLIGRARKAEREAQAASAAKTAFLSRMSHDLRTPLNGIVGLIEVNELNNDNVALMSENRAKAKVAADHLLTLVNDILEMGKIEDRKLVLEDKPFNVVELLDDVVVIGRLRASERGVTIYTDGGSHLEYPDVYGSPLHVRRILLNIVDNCVKYNKVGGRVDIATATLGVSEGRATYRFTISDTGIGMSTEFLAHIFEPFAQEAKDARSSFQGTGMGMPIVKGLVDKMGGSIDVRSTAGEGSVFVVTLCFAIDKDPKSHSIAEQRIGECSIAGLNIMLVEDNELNMEIASALITNAGASVTCVENGKRAVEFFESRPAGSFDVILMDIMMPEMNGYDAARAIRRSRKPDASSIPIIAMTANAFAEDVAQAREAGMNAHIPKPIDVEAMLKVISSCVHRV